jgi:hypothetical protein
VRQLFAHQSIDHHRSQWLRAELQSEASTAATYLIVLAHAPPFVDFWVCVASSTRTL